MIDIVLWMFCHSIFEYYSHLLESSFIQEEYMVLEIQFQSVIYMLGASICKNFEQNKLYLNS